MKKNNLNQVIILLAAILLCAGGIEELTAQPRTYCNPVDIDYTYMIYNAHKDLSYRSGADPAVVEFRGEYYMFVTRSMGYWYSKDLGNWEFISPKNWYFEGSNAPAAFNYRDSVLYVAGNPSGSMSILYSDNPKKGNWKATAAIINDLQDPALFIDDGGQAYMYWGSSNKFPIRVKQLDRNLRFRPAEETHELFNLDPVKHGWERFGENHSDTILGGYIEGPWLTKYKDKYYLQYAAPGTEFNVYGDGVYIGESPLGPFTYAPNNPVSYKPGGFITGAGHGSTVEGPMDRYWHFTTMAVNVNIGWERRIGMFPSNFDRDGLFYCDTYFGDYPRYLPANPEHPGQFTGWMLLSYNKPVKASSTAGEFNASNLVDEQVKTFWLAGANDKEQWVEIDLAMPCMVYALQLNFNDYQSGLYGRLPGLYHRYRLEGSLDGEQWHTIVDRSESFLDTPNAYLELSAPEKLRYVRYQNLKVPMPHLSISDIRVFGKGDGKLPGVVKKLAVMRPDDRREALVQWQGQKDCIGYNVLWGIAPDKLYSSWLLYGQNDLELRSLNTGQAYYFAVEAFNENGISRRSDIVKVE